MVAPWMPFRTLCLQQAIAARTMLARRGINSVLHLGVRDPTDTALETHAWLDVGGLNVTGYPIDPALIEVGHFV
ncbi:lasso peptide biosynthesis B2 protein [Sphingomonas sp. Leaf28]|uniref:lasso peptide biosynthesis B2 protein n=1 Tax=Sphingomonas sp. Leaf28 TaxID=1735695 RepID=UPI0012E2EFFB|nr:lasso peptide biosynthesis B2 protein [Sphingomonas sp. Leaf28]